MHGTWGGQSTGKLCSLVLFSLWTLNLTISRGGRKSVSLHWLSSAFSEEHGRLSHSESSLRHWRVGSGLRALAALSRLRLIPGTQQQLTTCVTAARGV